MSAPRKDCIGCRLAGEPCRMFGHREPTAAERERADRKLAALAELDRRELRRRRGVWSP